jgi:alcohol dehydrogenase (cytochrome c)
MNPHHRVVIPMRQPIHSPGSISRAAGRVLRGLVVAATAGGAIACVKAAPPVTAPAGPSAAAGDWVGYNGPPTGDRYSPLEQITTINVSQLRQRCVFDTPDTVSFQSGLVAVGGTLYFSVFADTYAIDGATCALKWKHTRPEPKNYLMVNRGVGYADGTIFRGTGDAHAVAIDATSGRELWDVPIGDPKLGESTPMAPIAWKGLVFIGNAGGDYFGVTGRIYALDAASGHTVWSFRTVSDSGPDAATWPKASPSNPPTGGAMWTSFAIDEGRGILYVTTGNPAPDFVEAFHPGENRYTNSVLALDARTGRLLAWVQPIKGDFHDWDVSAGPALITTRDGLPLVAAAAKDGFLYGIDRASLSASLPGGPDSSALAVRYRALATTRENESTPLSSERMTRFCPGTQGGMEWNGPTYQHQLGLLYVNSIDWCTSVKLQSLDTLKGAPGMPWSGMDDPQMGFGRFDPFPQARGWVTAIDAATGAIRWHVQTPKPMVAGITATAGGLVFTGDLDGNVLAYDARTGSVLWRSGTEKAIGGGVISYDAGGRQLVAVAAGLNSVIWPVHGGTARVIVYGLP